MMRKLEKKFCELNKNNRRVFSHGRGKSFYLFIESVHCLHVFIFISVIYYSFCTHISTSVQIEVHAYVTYIYNIILLLIFGKFILRDPTFLVHVLDVESCYSFAEAENRESLNRTVFLQQFLYTISKNLERQGMKSLSFWVNILHSRG